MPDREIDGARIHFRLLGPHQAGEPPILLIHGSTVDGDTDWAHLAPLLARHRQVVVPDCRGHGRSTDPSATYSFARLAADAAALIRALGHQRAHIVGHSNGGNVALVTLLEHPDVVATCVVQAGNAYVSADLIEREPDKFDPDRVEAEDTAWRDEMIAIHGPHHGREYWRELLRMTVAEIITQPQYTPAMLGRVDRPLLVIEGTNDTVNATSEHGRYIAQHVPDAELWRPEGVGHNVHHERPLEWVARVEDFWDRRGTAAADAIYRLGARDHGDPRTTVFDLHVVPAPGTAALAGVVLEEKQHRAALDAVRGATLEDRVTVLIDRAGWALVTRGVTDVLAAPQDRAERLTQALIGESVRTLDAREGWTRVRLERDGYVGWARRAALGTGPGAAVRGFVSSARLRVTSDFAEGRHRAGGTLLGRLPFGSRLPRVDEADDWLCLGLPDGGGWWVDRASVEGMPEAGQSERDADELLGRFRRFVGVPYLWGGRTPYGFDCSGLTQAFWEMLGRVIPRDADQQFVAGIAVEGAARAGDLRFFHARGGSEGDTAITHVGIALDEHRMLHASGASGLTTINSLRPGDPDFSQDLLARSCGVRRFGE